MPEMFPVLPKELEVTFWTRGRSKLTPKTGLGDKLKKVGAAYGKIKVSDVNKLLIARTQDEYFKALDGVMAQQSAVRGCVKALAGLSTFATTAARAAKASKVFPKKSRVLVERIASTADSYGTDIGAAIERMMKEGLAAHDDYDERLAHKTKLVNTTVAKLEQHAKAVAVCQKAIKKQCKTALVEAKHGGDDMSVAEPYVSYARRQIQKIGRIKDASSKVAKAWASDKTRLGKQDAIQFEGRAKTIARLQRGIVDASKACDELVEKTAATIERRKMVAEIERLKRERMRS